MASNSLSAGSGNLLLVEDDPDLREGLAELLRSEGYRVDCASNGLEALAHLHSGKSADLIILDLMMPRMDGWQFRMEQRRDPGIASIPVMAITADNSPQAGAIDAACVLRKPFELEQLLKSVAAVMASVQAERLAQTERLAALGRLAAGMAHEINNPLAYVLGNLRLLRDRWLTRLKDAAAALPAGGAGGAGAPAASEELEEIDALIRESLSGSERIEGIVRDIQIYSSSREDEPEPTDVRLALDSAMKIAAHRLKSRAEIHRDYRDVPAVMAHPVRLGQLFLNLLVNAADAIPEGLTERQTIHLSVYSEGSDCIVEISDPGSGIAASVLPRIFDPFFTTKPVGSGTGLGLFICRGIVTSLGGDISVESQVGKGTTFRVRLPTGRRPREEPVPASLPGQERARILVVDDDQLVSRGIARVLGHDHDVVTVSGGQEAVERLVSGEPFDLVLCDLHMPEVTGMDVWEEIRKRAPGLESKLIFMSGGIFTPRALEFSRTVANMVIDKPIDSRALRALISRVFAQT